ncbi:hypothetical protein XENTR_v10022514 [Xenopus tropicalis]|nr:hypothetical protein XENTR_v10022514 [Xenopus tropicalis]
MGEMHAIKSLRGVAKSGEWRGRRTVAEWWVARRQIKLGVFLEMPPSLLVVLSCPVIGQVASVSLQSVVEALTRRNI